MLDKATLTLAIISELPIAGNDFYDLEPGRHRNHELMTGGMGFAAAMTLGENRG